jgi:hypothetical protein
MLYQSVKYFPSSSTTKLLARLRRCVSFLFLLILNIVLVGAALQYSLLKKKTKTTNFHRWKKWTSIRFLKRQIIKTLSFYCEALHHKWELVLRLMFELSKDSWLIPIYLNDEINARKFRTEQQKWSYLFTICIKYLLTWHALFTTEEENISDIFKIFVWSLSSTKIFFSIVHRNAMNFISGNQIRKRTEMTCSLRTN